jgi:hypothetical protein
VTDDQLIIRHVRLCECGKLAEHDSICSPGRATAGLDPEREVQRVDASTEDLFAERRGERFAKRARGFAEERTARRAAMDLLALHRAAIERQGTLSTVKAGSTERGRGGVETFGFPPSQQQLDDDPRWREHWQVIRSRLLRVHELLDEAEGHGTVAGNMQMLGVEKDRLILSRENQGLSAQAVVDKLGSHIAGSAETVRRIRRNNGLDHRGYEREVA